MWNTLVSYAYPAGTLLWFALALVTAGHAIMFKRDPKGAALWVFIALSLPFFGAWLYWIAGINRVERRAARRVETRGRRRRRGDAPRHAADDFTAVARHLEPLCQVTQRVTRLRLVSGNAVQPLHHGESAFPAMLDAIRQARRNITLASFIFDWDSVGQDFVEALGAAASRGVRVHLLLDGIGAVRSFSRIGRALIKAGARVEPFFPLRFPFGRIRLHLRYHGKILVVDGATAFTGGMNISRRYLMDQDGPGRCEDLHFRLTGPIVTEIQHAFADEWRLSTGENLKGEAYFPELDSVGDAWCRPIISGPDENLEKIHWVVLGALAAARQSVYIVTPYFIPSGATIAAMAMASLRGVRVTLILPSAVDHRFMRWAADAYLWQLLEHGITVVRRPPPFVHTKLMVVDDRWTLLGSANMDRRSFRLNFEFNVEAYHVPLATELSRWLEGLIARSHQVTLEEVDSRPAPVRLRDGFAKLFSPYL